MKNILFLFIIGILTLAASCKKENINPEPEHENIFECYLNSNFWEPAGGDGHLGFDQELAVYYDDEFLNKISISAQREILGNDTIHQVLFLSAKLSDSVIGVYPIKRDLLFFDHYKHGTYYKDTLADNFIEIAKLDTAAKVVSGSFQFTAIDYEIQDTIIVSKGEFSAKYQKG